MTLKCAAISDTHNAHKDIWLPPDLDVLIHAGDFCSWGVESEAENFLEWFKKQDAAYKIFIAGNHDKCLEKYDAKDILSSIANVPNIFYLQDSEVIIEGHKFYGSPWTPEFGVGWAFNAKRGREIREIWDKIPEGCEVLITHGPPRGILDLIPPSYVRSYENPHVGCDDLLEAVTKIKPKYHIFGHIHCGYGSYLGNNTTFYNAATCDEQYRASNSCHVFTL